MKTTPVNSALVPKPAPPLAFSLWSLRMRMKTMPTETLKLIKKLGFKTVEIAGFFDLTSKQLQEDLHRMGFEICSIHGPSINLRPERTVKFYRDWAIENLRRFDSRTLALESASGLFPEDRPSSWESTYARLVDLIIKVARDLESDGYNVSYHCYLHDFLMIPGRPLVERLFADPSRPSNLKLQLDTFWLHRARIEPRLIADLPVHSVHLNERDEHGHCCVLGTRRERCADYARALSASGQKFVWILENDPCEGDAKDPSEPHLRTITQCVDQWPNFWASVTEPPEQSADTHVVPALPAATPGETGALKRLITPGREMAAIYELEVSEALTEDLLGNSKDLAPLDFNDPKVKYYVQHCHLNRDDPLEAADFTAEAELFERFWPPSNHPTVIQVVGGEGSGKSTFLRYFFQYFLPYRERLLVSDGQALPMAQIYEDAVRQHIVLYANLRRPDRQNLRQFVLGRIAKSLGQTAERLGLSEVLADFCNMESGPEAWLRKHLLGLALEKENGLRRWYISLFLDNADQMDEQSHGELINLLHEFIREEPPHERADEPVTRKGRALWRVVIPIRPETQSNLARFWHPFRNKRDFVLKPIKHDLLVTRRADFVNHTISESERPLFVDVWSGKAPRPEFDLKTSKEVATDFSQWFLAANGLGAVDPISAEARAVLDQLVNESGRRRLLLLRRAAFSRPFRERYSIGYREGWESPVSDRYFYEALLCGANLSFDPHADSLLVNLYGLGAKPHLAHSTFVGVHAVDLLRRGMKWGDVRAALTSIGYESNHLDKCEEWLEEKEILKRLYQGGHRVELSIVKGHWLLLKERAYTDNMATVCAQLWEQPEQVIKTDPLDFSQILPQFKVSLRFMQELWAREHDVGKYERAASQEKDERRTFIASVEKLKLTAATHYIAKEYHDRMKQLPDYPKAKAAIALDWKDWLACMGELEMLIARSGANPFLTAWVSGQ